MGSPDPRQIDGLGGADPLTSKICIIGPPTHAEADIDYTFGQVGIEEPFVALTTNCGNLLAAVGVYALEEGYVPAREPETTIRIYNTVASDSRSTRIPRYDSQPACRALLAPGHCPGWR